MKYHQIQKAPKRRKTNRISSLYKSLWDFRYLYADGPNFGSSPRVRGTGLCTCLNCLKIWFIPACAGNRAGAIVGTTDGTVHPRVCGEQADQICDTGRQPGSSPRVRGTDIAAVSIKRLKRFIPACAGNRPPRIPLGLATPVHPRVCGEQT